MKEQLRLYNFFRTHRVKQRQEIGGRKKVSITYARVFGWVFLILGMIGLYTHDLWGVIQLDPIQTAIHFVFGFTGIAMGHHKYTKEFSLFMGGLLVVIGIYGFLFVQLYTIHFEILENIIHILLGTWGVYIAWGETKPVDE